MRHTSLILSSFLLTAGLMSPISARLHAATQDDRAREESKKEDSKKRVYDRDHKDYHNWDDRENRSYEEFRRDHPKYNEDFFKADSSQQSEYWKWRHEHPDRD